MPTLAETRTATPFPAAPVATPADIQQATGFLVVCQSGGRRGNYAYEHFADLRDAADAYDEYERGEYPQFCPLAILACRAGVPFAKLSAWRMANLMMDARVA